MSKKPIIVFEGIECSGKSLHSNNVAYYLNHNLMKIEDDGNFYAKNRYMLTYEEVNI